MAARTPPGQTRNRIYAYVRDRLLAGDPPSTRDVQGAFGFKAVQSAREHLEALVDEGRLVKEPGIARGYRLPGLGGAGPAGGPAPRLVPVLGRVQAGALQAAIEDPDGYMPVDAPGGGELFALTVRGESMRDVGILPGDTVIVRRQPTAHDGEIVVALVGDEATVKRLRLREGRVELQPENPSFASIFPEPEELSLLGRVVEVRRKL